ncbi:MAG: FAD-binding oxidoreductase [Microthrixaceae bacterium]|nr:FAD-binding oxidoreductase [Microthrixaceae bacterium]
MSGSTLSPSSRARLETLAGAMQGELLLPDHAGWGEASAPWNLAVVQRPAAVALPADVADVQLLMAAARDTGLGVTVQPGGHGPHGGDLHDCILVRTAAFDELTIDIPTRTARVGAGVRWGRVLQALEGTGLLALAGSNPTINVAAFTLGGGHSSFGRSFGLAAHSLLAVEMVTADGRAIRVGDGVGDDDELLWALKGGGGQFGVVTALEFRLHPAPATGRLYGGKLTFPAAAAGPVLRAVLDVAASAPEPLSISAVLMVLPDLPFVPEPLRGQSVVTVDIVSQLDREATESMLEPIRSAGAVVADTVAAFGIGALTDVFAEPVDPVPALEWSALLGSLTHPAVDALVAAFAEGAALGLSLLQIRPLGGAIGRAVTPPAVAGVAGVLAAHALLGATGLVFDPAMVPGIGLALGKVRDAAAPHTVHGRVVTFLAPGEDLGAAYGAPEIARLRAVKARVDPGGTIRSNRPLPLA